MADLPPWPHERIPGVVPAIGEVLQPDPFVELHQLAALYGYDPRPIVDRCVTLGQQTAGSTTHWIDRARDLMIQDAMAGELPDAEAIAARLQPSRQRWHSVDVHIEFPELDLDAPAVSDEWVGTVESVEGGHIRLPLEFWRASTPRAELATDVRNLPVYLDEPVQHLVAAAFASALDAIPGVSAAAHGSRITVHSHPNLGMRPQSSSWGASIIWTQTCQGSVARRRPAYRVTIDGREQEYILDTDDTPEEVSRAVQDTLERIDGQAKPLPPGGPAVDEEKLPPRSHGLLSLDAAGRLYPALRSVPWWLRTDVLALVSVRMQVSGDSRWREGWAASWIMDELIRLLELPHSHIAGVLAHRLLNQAKHDGVLSRRMVQTPPHRWRRSASFPWPTASIVGNRERAAVMPAWMGPMKGIP